MEYARKIRDDRKCNVQVVDDGNESPEEMGSDVFNVSYFKYCQFYVSSFINCNSYVMYLFLFILFFFIFDQ